MTAGYSGATLAGKLGLKPEQRAWFAGMPDSVFAEIEPTAIGLTMLHRPIAPIDAAHVFVTSRADLEAAIEMLRERLAPDGFLWISWPKKASKIFTDVTDETVREVALPTGLVDVKVCAVDASWSALKLVIRTALRR